MGFADVILKWFALNGRELPWRMTSDPYRIWISEVILQQTRVEQGEAYYRRFTERFPDVKSLADAGEDDVMRLWQGLGYYSRARNLHAAAKAVGGRPFPSEYADLLKLKGVGEYTAAAIASIAFGKPYAVVDGNVYRVLSRYFGIAVPVDTPAGRREFGELAQSLLDKDRPGIYNQAVMDFGALQCTPKSPRCGDCPLREGCVAFSAGKIGELPKKSGKAKTRRRYFTYLLASSGGDVYIRKRVSRDIWRSLWEFPVIETASPFCSPAELLGSRQFREIFGGRKVVVSPLAKGVKHVLTHQTIFADFYKAELCQAGGLAGFEAVAKENIGQYAFPALLLPFLSGIV